MSTNKDQQDHWVEQPTTDKKVKTIDDKETDTDKSKSNKLWRKKVKIKTTKDKSRENDNNQQTRETIMTNNDEVSARKTGIENFQGNSKVHNKHENNYKVNGWKTAIKARFSKNWYNLLKLLCI